MHHWPKGDGRPCRQREKQAKRRTNNVRELGRSIQMAIELKALCSRSWYRKADFTKEKILTRREVSCPNVPLSPTKYPSLSVRRALGSAYFLYGPWNGNERRSLAEARVYQRMTCPLAPSLLLRALSR